MAKRRRVVEARREGRRLYVAGLMVPWDEQIRVGGEPEWWSRGALDAQLNDPQRRSEVDLTVQHASYSDLEEIASIGDVGRLVDTENRRSGQWGDFEVRRSKAGRMAWLLAKDGTLPAFSVEFFSIDPPHDFSVAPDRGATKAYGEVRHAVLDAVTLTDRPVYKRARATAEARRRHPELHSTGTALLVSAQQLRLDRERAASTRRIQ